jgi:predicted nucleic acid-binding protein
VTNILVDSNVILDIFKDDPIWANWSEAILDRYCSTHILSINPVIYAEVSIGFGRLEECENALSEAGFELLDFPRKALFQAGKAFVQYKKRGGTKRSPLPDFFIGAHAEVAGIRFITRDAARYRTYFPTVPLVSPDTTPLAMP